jgi:hypothetical protein
MELGSISPEMEKETQADCKAISDCNDTKCNTRNKYNLLPSGVSEERKIFNECTYKTSRSFQKLYCMESNYGIVDELLVSKEVALG